jgi:quinol monooxygenase YgiN
MNNSGYRRKVMNDENIVLMARLKVKSDKIEEAKAAALAIVEPSRNEPGCINYDVHQTLDDPAVFLWHETWSNQKAIDEHFEMPYFKDFVVKMEEIAEHPAQIILSKKIS